MPSPVLAAATTCRAAGDEAAQSLLPATAGASSDRPSPNSSVLLGLEAAQGLVWARLGSWTQTPRIKALVAKREKTAELNPAVPFEGVHCRSSPDTLSCSEMRVHAQRKQSPRTNSQKTTSTLESRENKRARIRRASNLKENV